MIRRAGSEISLTAAGPEPLGQPVAGGGGGGAGVGGCGPARVTTAVGAEDANELPSAFFASTLNRIVLPTSAEVSMYVAACAPLIVEQLPPVLSQRVQKSLKSV